MNVGLIILFAAVGAVLLTVGIVIDCSCSWVDGIGFKIFGVIILIIAMIMGAFAWHDSVYRDVNTEVLRQEYNALIIQLDNDFYNKFTYDGREKLIKQIVDYNETVTRGRAYHDSKWLGAFNQENFDSLPLIDLHRINKGD